MTGELTLSLPKSRTILQDCADFAKIRFPLRIEHLERLITVQV